MRVPKDTRVAVRELADHEHVTLMEALSRAVKTYSSIIRSDQLVELADWDGISVEEARFRAIDGYYGYRLIGDTNAAFAALRDDPEQWAEIESERRLWNSTLSDGLGEEEVEPTGPEIRMSISGR